MAEDTRPEAPPSLASPEPDTAAMGAGEGGWRARAETAEARLAAIETNLPAALDALRLAAADAEYGARAKRFTTALKALGGSDD